MKQCPISDICTKYDSGTNMPPNHHVRKTVACQGFLSGKCQVAIDVQLICGEPIACDINKIRRLRGNKK